MDGPFCAAASCTLTTAARLQQTAAALSRADSDCNGEAAHASGVFYRPGQNGWLYGVQLGWTVADRFATSHWRARILDRRRTARPDAISDSGTSYCVAPTWPLAASLRVAIFMPTGLFASRLSHEQIQAHCMMPFIVPGYVLYMM